MKLHLVYESESFINFNYFFWTHSDIFSSII